MKILRDKLNKTDKWATVPSSIIHDKRISADAKILYQVLFMSNQDPKKGKVFAPSIGSLASQFGKSEREVKYWFAELRKFGYVTSNGDNYHKIIYLHKHGARDCTKNKNMVQEIAPNMVHEIAPIINKSTDVEKSTSIDLKEVLAIAATNVAAMAQARGVVEDTFKDNDYSNGVNNDLV